MSILFPCGQIWVQVLIDASFDFVVRNFGWIWVQKLWHCGSVLVPVWDHFGSILDSFGVYFGFILAPFGVFGRVLWRKSSQVGPRTAGVNERPPSSWKRSGTPKGGLAILGWDGKSPRGGVRGGVNPPLLSPGYYETHALCHLVAHCTRTGLPYTRDGVQFWGKNTNELRGLQEAVLVGKAWTSRH